MKYMILHILSGECIIVDTETDPSVMDIHPNDSEIKLFTSLDLCFIRWKQNNRCIQQTLHGSCDTCYWNDREVVALRINEYEIIPYEG